MAKKWFRFYVEVPDDPKVHRLPDALYRFWVNCLCLAARNDGVLPEATDIAYHVRKPVERVQVMIAGLVDAKLLDRLDDGRLAPHNWKGRQYETDASTPRVAAYRKRVRDAGRAVNGYAKHRETVYARDGSQCVYCGNNEHLCLDHVIPVSLGGDDEPDNLATACKGCNSGKSGRTPEQAGMTIQAGRAYGDIYQRNKSRLLASSVTVSRNTRASVSVSVSDSVSEIGKRFREFWARWCELTKRKQHESDACHAWLSVVETAEQVALAMACLERYGASADVAKGVITNPEKWIYEQARDGWRGDWQPPPNKRDKDDMDVARKLGLI